MLGQILVTKQTGAQGKVVSKVSHKPSAGGDAFLWLSTIVHLVADVVNGRFTFETLTAPTEGTTRGRNCKFTKSSAPYWRDKLVWLTLTNYALYFEESGVISYNDSNKLKLSEDFEQSVKPAATGPWGAPLFDKAIVYESSELEELVVLEFPEMTSSTRRDHWLALIKEIILLHQFLRKFKVDSPSGSQEIHARTILGIIRLHASREMLRISPPMPKNFLIFDILDELPKGDYVLEELAESLKKVDIPSEAANDIDDNSRLPVQYEELKGEGIGNSVQVLIGLLKPFGRLVPCLQEVFSWERPLCSSIAMLTALLVIYTVCWQSNSSSLFGDGWYNAMGKRRIVKKANKIVIYTGSDQTTMESIVSAQHGLKNVSDLVQSMNVILLKICSILVSKAPKHADMVMVVMVGVAVILPVVPFKFILMALTLCLLVATSKIGKYMQDEKVYRRLKEWWDSIPVVPVEFVEKLPDS